MFTLALDPTDWKPYLNRANANGRALARRGEYDRAIADITKAIDIDPRNASAFVVRGMAFGVQPMREFKWAMELYARDSKHAVLLYRRQRAFNWAFYAAVAGGNASTE